MPHGHWPATQTIWDALVGARCQRDHRVALLPDVRSLRRLLGLPHPLAPTFISHTLGLGRIPSKVCALSKEMARATPTASSKLNWVCSTFSASTQASCL